MTEYSVEMIRGLPDNLEPTAIDEIVLSFMGDVLDGHVAPVEISDGLFELVSRYNNVFSFPSESARRKISDWLIQNWNDTDVEFVENTLGVIANIGLHEVLSQMLQSSREAPHEYVRREFCDFLGSLGEPPWDPYKNYMNPKKA